MKHMGEHMIYIGTSGFSYEDWKGPFYPERTAKKDMLSCYARAFPAVEINSTYYAIPSPQSFAAMISKTPASFEFVVKAHQEMTHSEKPESGSFESFLESIEPLREAGRLGCVLAQFPWAFKNNTANEDRLRDLKDRMGELPTVIEFRNSEWVSDETFALLKELNLGFCSVDEPALKGLMPRVSAATSEIGYVRFHGRNAKQWWRHEESYERYNYLYSEDELREWVPRVEELNAATRKTYLFFNNHYQGKSAENAKMFAAMLGVSLAQESSTTAGGQMTLGEGF